MRRNAYAYFSQDDPFHLVMRAFNMTKLCELGTALNTSRGGWVCFLGAFRDPVLGEIDGAFVAHGGSEKATYVSRDTSIRAKMNDTISAKIESNNHSAAMKRPRGAVATTTNTARVRVVLL